MATLVPQLTPVQSSFISQVGYVRQHLYLFIETRDGNIYLYTGVSRKTYDELRNAPSLGAYFNQNIRNSYATVRVR
jgi:hypothetical protein